MTPGLRAARWRSVVAVERIEIELGNRYSLLLTHGLMGVLAGALILLFGLGPALAQVEGGRLIFGLLGLLAGIVTHSGTVLRRLGAQLVGMSLLAAWYGALVVGYVLAAKEAPGGFPVPSWPWQPSRNLTAPYAFPLFLGLLALSVRHVVTVWKIRARR